jgi:hypothetical protein
VITSEDQGLHNPVWPQWIIVLEGFSHTLITFNSSMNFFIYLVI